MPEIWRFIEGAEYQVSNLGRVKSFYNGTQGYIMKPSLDSKGYSFVRLCGGDYQGRKPKVHRLVLQTFIGSAPDGYQADHVDGNKQNNKLSNLEWVTPLENFRRAQRLGLRGKARRFQNGEIWLIRRLLKRCTEAFVGKMFKVNQSCIHRIKTREAYADVY